jgi:hypothetical protein
MDDAALREKLGIYAGCGRNNGNLDFQMDTESEWIARGEGGTATTKVFTGSVLLESRARQIHATNHNWKMHRDSAFPSALEGWGRSAGSGHPCTSSGYSLGKKAIHSIENFGRGAGRMHVPAQFSAISDAVGEVTGELLHSSNRVWPFGINQIPEI